VKWFTSSRNYSSDGDPLNVYPRRRLRLGRSLNGAEDVPNGGLGTGKNHSGPMPGSGLREMLQAAFVGEAKGLSVHFTPSALTGSTLLQCRHLRSVLPSDVATAIMRLLQCGHRVWSMTPPPYFPQNERMEQKFQFQVLFGYQGEFHAGSN
jgi:hypothetical protein